MTYNTLAYVYDELMAHAPYEEWVNFTMNVINNREVQSIVDLGCGTGSISVRLAKSGYHVTGVDKSADMLTAADEKARNEYVNINFIQQDIRSLTGFKDVDLFISYCDVINYITNEKDITALFKNVHQSLQPDGLFIFDIHALPYVEDCLIDQTFTDETDNLVYIWSCEKGKHQGEM